MAPVLLMALFLYRGFIDPMLTMIGQETQGLCVAYTANQGENVPNPVKMVMERPGLLSFSCYAADQAAICHAIPASTAPTIANPI